MLGIMQFRFDHFLNNHGFKNNVYQQATNRCTVVFEILSMLIRSRFLTNAETGPDLWKFILRMAAFCEQFSEGKSSCCLTLQRRWYIS